jgi:hypothetical protein
MAGLNLEAMEIRQGCHQEPCVGNCSAHAASRPPRAETSFASEERGRKPIGRAGLGKTAALDDPGPRQWAAERNTGMCCLLRAGDIRELLPIYEYDKVRSVYIRIQRLGCPVQMSRITALGILARLQRPPLLANFAMCHIDKRPSAVISNTWR